MVRRRLTHNTVRLAGAVATVLLIAAAPVSLRASHPLTEKPGMSPVASPEVATEPPRALEDVQARSFRPEWLGRTAWRDGQTDWFVMASRWWATPGEAVLDAAEQARQLVREQVLGSDHTGPDVDQLVTTNLVRDRFVTDMYMESSPREYGTMYKAHILVKIDPANRELLLAARATRNRLLIFKRAVTATISLLLLAAVVLAYLWLDEITLGYYRAHLRVAAAAVFLAASLALLHVGGWTSLVIGY